MNLQQTCDFGLEFCVTHTEHIEKLGIAFGKTVIYFCLGSIKQKGEGRLQQRNMFTHRGSSSFGRFGQYFFTKLLKMASLLKILSGIFNFA